MTDTPAPLDGASIIAQFIPNSPYVGFLGIELVEMGVGTAALRMGFREELVTIGRTIHGGAIASLIDTAAMAAAWAGAEVPENLRGSTVGLTVHYLAPADEEDVEAHARVVRRGRRLVTVQVDVTTTSGAHVATALATYQLG